MPLIIEVWPSYFPREWECTREWLIRCHTGKECSVVRDDNVPRRGHQQVAFHRQSLADYIADTLKNPGLCAVFAEGCELHVCKVTQLQRERMGYGRSLRQFGPVPNIDKRSVRVIELLWRVRHQAALQLLRE